MKEDADFRERMQSMESLIQEIERFPDPKARAHTQEIVRAILDMHGTAITKLVGMIEHSSPSGAGLLRTLARDDLVSSLLLLYGLHPDDLSSRVGRAIERLRPSIAVQGGDVEFLEAVDGVIRVRLCHREGGSSPSEHLKRSLEEAIYMAAPDALAVEVEEGAISQTEASTRIPLTVLSR
jgi:Fe-S cluster biogenesis protein NfuA